MTDTTQTQTALALQTYLDTSASPLGPALQRMPLMNIGLDEGELATLPLHPESVAGLSYLQAPAVKGLKLSMHIEPDQVRNALIWQMQMEQSEQQIGPRVHHFRPVQIAFDGTLASDLVIHTWRGGAQQTFFPPDAVTPQRHVLYPRTAAYYQEGHLSIGTHGGRSSDEYMPYVLITTADDSGGIWLALGWSGHWSGHFSKPQGTTDLQFTIQIDPCDLHVPAGSHLQGPIMAAGLYKGDSAAGWNALRSWLRSRMPELPESDLSHFNSWTAMDANVNEARLLEAVEQVAGNGLRYFMLDAGWYPSPLNDFNGGVGNWSVDETKFPHGLEIVAERVRAQGMQMGLWFEPERAHLTSDLATRHPDWLLRIPGREHALVNFALPAVRAHFRAVIAGLVERLQLRWLKWDFNMDPLPYWEQANDGGLAHLGHINGLWETFDWLRSTFPELIIENCASGGNRLDWAIFSRAHVNFANDQYTQPDCIRRILGRMSAFLPTERLNMIYGPSQRRTYDDATWQIMMGSAFGVSEPIDNWTEHFQESLRHHLSLHHITDVQRSGDFYRLTPDSDDLRAWEGWQLHEPGTGSGVVALWRCASPQDQFCLRLREIDETRMYQVFDLYHHHDSQTVAGQQLAHGLTVSLSRDAATLWMYRPVEGEENK